jgi:serine-type D-Ala-D-Ala carboxypeptidase/endopeptidase (penicillin-binding protein 4)
LIISLISLQFKANFTFLKETGTKNYLMSGIFAFKNSFMNLPTYFLIVLFFLAESLSGQTNSRLIYEFLSNKALSGASVAVVATDLQSGDILLSENPALLLAPASTVKLITSGVALQLLTPGFHFETLLETTAKPDPQGGRLHGNLVVRGGGDPTTGSEWFSSQSPDERLFDKWAGYVKSAGISSIHGDIVLDISGFQQWTVPLTWMWEDVGNYYGAGPATINLFDNTVRLRFNSPPKSGARTEIVSVYPEIQGVEWINEVLSSDINRDLAYVFGSPWDKTRIIRGTIPVKRRNFEVKAAMPDPPRVFGNLLKEHLIKSGIEVTGDVVLSFEIIKAEPFRRVVSPSLAEICSVLNTESVNLIAESLIMQLSFRQNGYGHHANGMQIMSDFLKENVIDGSFFLDDGSGLSRFTAISAGQMNQFLRYMHQGENSEIFKSAMPVAGTGTLKGFSTRDFPGLSLRCKSGSMTRVRAYAGYLSALSGREIAFTIIANNFTGSQQEVFRAIEGLLIKMRNEL